MKIIRIEFHVESDDDGDTESVGKGFTCFDEESVKRYRSLFDATVAAMGDLEGDIYEKETGEPRKTEAGNYRRLADALRNLYLNFMANGGDRSETADKLLDEFLGDAWRK